MNDWIILIILTIVGIIMVAGGTYLAHDWNKRIHEWDSTPSTDEYFSCLFEGWIGVFGATLGSILLCLCVFVTICLFV